MSHIAIQNMDAMPWRSHIASKFVQYYSSNKPSATYVTQFLMAGDWVHIIFYDDLASWWIDSAYEKDSRNRLIEFDAVGPFDTPDQAFVYLKMSSE